MTQSSSEKFLHFTVGLLKDSEALEALRQDAVKHHMIDNPGQLIALRLTEYYDMMNRGIVQPVIQVPAVVSKSEPVVQPTANSSPSPVHPVVTPVQMPTPTSTYEAPAPRPVQPVQPAVRSMSPSNYGSNNAPAPSQVTGRMRALMKDGDTIVTTSNNADQNADDAADYWSLL
ncbi:hypothetical protein [Dictyobacter arantiisoli]|uniref:Uncharacterized protein n=1 Tax=Dictyobacter arantiisoli TaxID=2014874 RepID=A0A5A5TIH7_9CHLR|nr:hypothetical protein [Dictyobacter arantiisoli]GCF10853.1 hypothetical protein KDI_44170 [Dictyobacter arantiisoli]